MPAQQGGMGEPTMDVQRFSIKGRVLADDDPQLQDALAQVHETPERPRCLCVRGGIEMYVARHRQFVVKRMPETGSLHAPFCPSYEPEAQQSGLGELLGESVLEREPGKVELRVDFPWTRTTGPGAGCRAPHDVAEISRERHRMSLRPGRGPARAAPVPAPEARPATAAARAWSCRARCSRRAAPSARCR